jgi:hypothetical protein
VRKNISSNAQRVQDWWQTVHRGDPEQIEQMLDDHPQWLEHPFQGRNTALGIACKQDLPEAVAMLIRKGANIEHRNCDG